MSEGFPQLEKVANNLNRQQLLQPSWGGGYIAQQAGGPVGEFRFLCKASHVAYDDPIVFPGQVGRSHLHMFFGNTLTSATSTYESLRTTGLSSCQSALNRSAYWIPALMNGRGQVVMPEYVSIYYKRMPYYDPLCQKDICVGLPRGLRFVFGRTMSGLQTAPTEGGVYFNCDGPGAVPAAYGNLAEAARNCPNGAVIGAIVNAPECWNGRDLDSPDHRSHMSEFIRDGFGQVSCPTSHPYRLPHFSLQAWFATDSTLDRSGDTSPTANTWYFSSDRMTGMPALTSGTTFHADWYGAWDDETLDTWMGHCINKMLNCSGGDLGNGTQMVFSNEYNNPPPRLIPVPADPKG